MTKVETTPPTISIYGCGGCGINLVRKVNPYIKDKVKTVECFDTSYSNVRSDDEEIILITEHDGGSGKVRAEHAQNIQKFFTNISDEKLQLSEINIVIFSLSGGSGSVAGPTLIKNLHKRGQQCIVIAIADTVSEIDIKNTLGGLRTLQSIANNDGIYLPVSVFDNSVGRNIVDASVIVRINQLIHILSAPAYEIDRNDRKNFLNGIKTIGLNPGLRLIHVRNNSTDDDVAGSGEIWTHNKDIIYDSVLSIGAERIVDDVNERLEVNYKVSSRTSYSGTFVNNKDFALMAVIYPNDEPVQVLMRKISDVSTIFNAQTKTVSSVITSNDKVQTIGDIIL